MAIDPVSLTIAISSVVIAVLTHVRYSRCFGVEIVTKDKSNDCKKEEAQPSKKKNADANSFANDPLLQ